MVRTRAASAVAALAVATASLLMYGAPATAADEPACARPNVPAHTIRAIAPDAPPLAAQQGIVGDVDIVISLDENSRVTAARVRSSPSAILNNAALTAARQSTFQTEIRGCRPIAADYIFRVSFSVAASAQYLRDGTPVVVATAEGTSTAVPDTASVVFSIRSAGTEQAAAAADLAAVSALDERLARAGVTAGDAPTDVRRAADPATNATILDRTVTVTAPSLSALREVMAAAAGIAGTRVASVVLGIRNSDEPYARAVAAATSRAEDVAREFASGSHVQLGRRIAVQPAARVPARRTLPYLYGNVVIPPPPTAAMLESPIDVRATVTVIYELTR